MEPDEEWSPSNLWDDFDPYEDDLNIEVAETVEQEDIEIDELTYVSHYFEDQPIVIYGFFALPLNQEKLPAVLHIHGGGQTASREHVIHWAKRGYAALSFDWTGPTENREKFSDLGEVSTDKYLVQPTPCYSHLYHGVLVARRGLTFLEDQPEIDPDRLGIYGISWGGFLSWLVNGSDSRVKVSTAIYGCGGTLKRGNATGSDFDTEDDEQRLWNYCFNPFGYAGLLSGAMMLLNSTNDFFGWMDTAEELFSILPAHHSLCFCPHFNHHIDENTSRNLYAWIDAHLKDPASPWPAQTGLELFYDDGIKARIQTDHPDEVESVEAFMAGHYVPSPSRFWAPLPVANEGDEWVANAIVPDAETAHSIFATVHYRRGISVSSIP
ncbi:MAG: acetylxylan esterase, partial [Planctomycetota bacterium]|nr:acetylxylan esterase [Planctomycetota bacterium]